MDEVADPVEDIIAAVRRHSKPDQDSIRSAVDIAHQTNLHGLFLVIGLVDAYGVDP